MQKGELDSSQQNENQTNQNTLAQNRPAASSRYLGLNKSRIRRNAIGTSTYHSSWILKILNILISSKKYISDLL